MSKYSENEDDPEVYESSGDEWKEEEEIKINSRRSSQRLSKKPRQPVVEFGSSDEDSDIEPRKRAKNGVNRRVKAKKEEDDDEEEEEEDTFSENQDSREKSENHNNDSETKIVSTTTATIPAARGIHRKFIPKTIYSEEYATGSFVILKKDAQVGDPSKHPCIWRIDGKALLQKYEAFDEDGKVRHKNTSIYTGWSPMDKDLYAPVTVDVIQHSNQNLTVELHWDKLKSINVDSD